VTEVAAGRPIKVVRVISRLNVGGPAIQAITLTRCLVDRDYETTLVRGSEGEREGNMDSLAAELGVAPLRTPSIHRELGRHDARAGRAHPGASQGPPGRSTHPCREGGNDRSRGGAPRRFRRVVVGRLFNTVGPRQTGRYGMVVPSFVKQALAGQSIEVFGDGSQQRCFCHVGDVVHALADLMLTEDAHGQVFNIGATEEVSIMDLAKRVRELAQSDSEIVTVPYDEAYGDGFEDMPRRIPDTTKINTLLGWEPTRNLDQILLDVVESHRVEEAVA